MKTTSLLTLVMTLPMAVAAGGVTAQEAPTAADYQALWSGGLSYRAFYDAATERRALWEGNTSRAHVPAELLARARAVPGEWRLLAVAVDGCSDSVNTLPYIAALVDAVPGLALRIVSPQDGRAVMEAFRTPDGRAATPTVVVLNSEGRALDAFIERPQELQTVYLANPQGLSDRERYDYKMRWYDEDAGASTLDAIVRLLESAPTR